MKEYKYAVCIGRFQPVHNAHIKLIERALEVAENVIVVVGSHRATLTIKNPFTSEERIRMLAAVFGKQLGRFSFVTARDYLYNDNLWLAEVQMKVGTIIEDSRSVCIVGSYSDDSSYYLKCFPHWKQVLIKSQGDYHATDIRDKVFAGNSVEHLVPPEVHAFLSDFILSDRYISLCEEFDFIKKYKADWSRSPYPPTFVTVDAVVVKSGHILLVKRRSAPGKGLYALPGGFVNQRETISNATIREVKEETGLWVSNPQVTQVFDHPDRSLRGRTITHASLFDLGAGELPNIKGGDDAASAHWVALNDIFLHEDRFFEDHIFIIQTLVYKQ